MIACRPHPQTASPQAISVYEPWLGKRLTEHRLFRRQVQGTSAGNLGHLFKNQQKSSRQAALRSRAPSCRRLQHRRGRLPGAPLHSHPHPEHHALATAIRPPASSADCHLRIPSSAAIVWRRERDPNPSCPKPFISKDDCASLAALWLMFWLQQYTYSAPVPVFQTREQQMRAKSPNRRVTLSIRIRLKSGRRQYATPVIASNGKLKPGYALIDGQKEFHPEGVYVLRYRSLEGKQVWESVGADPQLASIAKLRRENVLQAEGLGLNTYSSQVAPHPGAIDRQSVSDDCERYLQVVAGTTRRRTLSSYQHALGQFMHSCGPKHTQDLAKLDVQNFVSTLKKQGLSPRTCANRVCVVRSFLRWAGYPDVISKREIPRYTEKVAAAYSTKQIMRLLDASPMEERTLWQFFLGSGGREQEVMYATWADIDFDTGLFTVREKPSMGFFIKDSQERSIPLPDDLLKVLRERKAHRSSDHLLFPTLGSKADGHFLRKLKRTAFNAGLNCGHCSTKRGSSCASAPVCRTWELHRFRKTMATLHHEAGMSARTLMRLLGHSDFATTLKYLEAADVRSESMRTAVNLSFRNLFETPSRPPA